MKQIICIAGGIASGKTTIARLLAATFPASHICSFGDTVRRRASAAGVKLSRPELQRLGLVMISEGWPSFVDALLDEVPHGTQLLIVDGVRHVAVMDELETRFPNTRKTVVFLQSDKRQTQLRLAARAECSDALVHAVESDLGNVERLADLVIPPSSKPDETLQEVKRLVAA